MDDHIELGLGRISPSFVSYQAAFYAFAKKCSDFRKQVDWNERSELDFAQVFRVADVLELDLRDARTSRLFAGTWVFAEE